MNREGGLPGTSDGAVQQEPLANLGDNRGGIVVRIIPTGNRRHRGVIIGDGVVVALGGGVEGKHSHTRDGRQRVGAIRGQVRREGNRETDEAVTNADRNSVRGLGDRADKGHVRGRGAVHEEAFAQGERGGAGIVVGIIPTSGRGNVRIVPGVRVTEALARGVPLEHSHTRGEAGAHDRGDAVVGAAQLSRHQGVPGNEGHIDVTNDIQRINVGLRHGGERAYCHEGSRKD